MEVQERIAEPEDRLYGPALTEDDPKRKIFEEGKQQVVDFLAYVRLEHYTERFLQAGYLYGMKLERLTQGKLKKDLKITDEVEMEQILSASRHIPLVCPAWKQFETDHAESVFGWVSEPRYSDAPHYVGNTPTSGGTYQEKWGIHPDANKLFDEDLLWITAAGCDGMMFLWPADHPDAEPPCVRCGQPHFQICTDHVTDWERMMTVSCGGDCRIQVLDLKTAKTVQSIKNNSKVDVSESFLSIEADLEVNKCCVGTAGGMVKVADLEYKKILLVMKGPLDDVYDVKVDWDLNMAVGGSWDHNLHIYDLRSGRRTRVLKGHRHIVNKIDVDFEQQLALSAAWEEYMILWDLRQASMIKAYHTPNHEANCISADWRSMRAATGANDGLLKFWDLESGECTQTIDCEFLHTLALDVHWDLGVALAGSWDQQVRLFDCETGEMLKRFKKARRVINSVEIKKAGSCDRAALYNAERDAVPGDALE